MPEKAHAADVSGPVAPFRYYLQDVGPEGLRAYAIATWPSGSDLKDLLVKGEVVTEDEVEGKFRELRIDLVGDGPGAFAEALNIMRVTVHAKDALSHSLAPYEDALKSVERCVDELSRTLPKVIDAHRKVDSERAVASAAHFSRLLEAIKAYQGERWVAFGGRPPSRRREPWHGDAVYLMGLYNEARANPDILSGVNSDSSIVRFIAWAFERTGNKQRETGAIAQALNRRNRPAAE
jgi:hypothetical protein